MNSDIHSHESGNIDGESTSTLSRGEVFDVLSNPRRRCILDYLKRNAGDSPVERSDVVDYVTAWETGTAIGDHDPAARKRVYNALRQTHLPKLVDVGLIEYDEELNTITLTDAARTAQLYLEYVPEDDIPWYQYFIGLAATIFALTIAVWLEIYPFVLAESIFVGIVLAAFATSSVVYASWVRSSRVGSTDRFAVPE